MANYVDDKFDFLTLDADKIRQKSEIDDSISFVNGYYNLMLDSLSNRVYDRSYDNNSQEEQMHLEDILFDIIKKISVRYVKDFSEVNKRSYIKYWIEKFVDRAQLMFIGNPDGFKTYMEDICTSDWKCINFNGVDTDYWVSNMGVIWSDLTHRFLVQMNHPCGYNIVTLYSDGKPLVNYVHRLVAKAFCENDDPVNKTEVNHINGNKKNNWYRNLEWVTTSENNLHAFRTGLHVAKVGEENGASKYKTEQVKQACELLMDTSITYDKIAEMTGIDAGSINAIVAKRAWVHISKDYDFPKRDNHPKGADSWSAKFTEKQIHHVCQLLQDRPDLTYKQIEDITGVSKVVVGTIQQGKAWIDISKNYKFQSHYRRTGDANPKSKYTEKQIEEVCNLLDEKLCKDRQDITFTRISKMTGVGEDLIGKIFTGKNRIDIAKQHPFYKAKFGEEAIA